MKIFLIALFSTLGCYFEMLSRSQSRTERKQTQQFYHNAWVIIIENKLIQLPRKSVELTIKLISQFNDFYNKKMVAIRDRNLFMVNKYERETRKDISNSNRCFVRVTRILIMPITGTIGIILVSNGWWSYLAAFIFFIVWGGAGFLAYLMDLTNISYEGLAIVSIYDRFSWVGSLIVLVLWGKMIITSEIEVAFILTLLFFPLIPILAMDIIYHFFNISMGGQRINLLNEIMYYKPDRLGFATFSAGLSILLTITSIFIGSQIETQLFHLNTLQMLLSNIIFDTATVIVTIKILIFITNNNLQPITFVMAIILDLSIAAIFASFSLWLGLVFTSNELNIYEIFNILIGLSADGASFHFGSYFWIMHTAFLPTLLYLGIILSLSIPKISILPLAKLFYKGALAENPHSLTAAYFLFLAALTTLYGTVTWRS